MMPQATPLTIRHWLLLLTPSVVMMAAPLVGSLVHRFAFWPRPHHPPHTLVLSDTYGFGLLGLFMAAALSLALAEWLSWRNNLLHPIKRVLFGLGYAFGFFGLAPLAARTFSFGVAGLVVLTGLAFALGQWLSWRNFNLLHPGKRILFGIGYAFGIYGVNLLIAFPGCAYAGRFFR